uniref:Protein TRIGALACTOSYLDIACYLGLYCEROL 4 n=1 Tax=Davidia involucrata TaxID=16924 RepID=A0A5B7BNP7_DAVIN
MKKLRWTMDGSFWDLDMSTPRTIDGLARPVPGDPLPLGISRGVRLSRPKQIDFFQRFMTMPFVPSYAGNSARGGGDGFSLQRVLNFPFGQRWFATLLGQFNLQKFVSSIKENGLMQPSESSWLQGIGRHLRNKSLYALGFCSEFLITQDDTVLVSLEGYGDKKTPRKKAVLHHKFPHHNLTVEAAWPELFVDQLGAYWDIPFSMAIDLASVASDSGASYHLCINHNVGSPKQFEGQPNSGVPATLLPGLCIKSAFSFKKNIDVWRSKAPKLKMVQPFDIFLSNPHISASGLLGAVVTASLGDNIVRAQVDDETLGFKGFSLRVPDVNSAILADIFASVSFSAQHGNFQRLFLDLTRFYARLDFPSGSKFLSGATRLAHDLYNSQRPNLETVQAICPNATLSLQQQIAGPFSFRVDSGVALSLKNRDWHLSVNEPVFAIEYALQVLGSAKAVAWYSPKQREFMIELRFFET